MCDCVRRTSVPSVPLPLLGAASPTACSFQLCHPLAMHRPHGALWLGSTTRSTCAPLLSCTLWLVTWGGSLESPCENASRTSGEGSIKLEPHHHFRAPSFPEQPEVQPVGSGSHAR